MLGGMKSGTIFVNDVGAQRRKRLEQTTEKAVWRRDAGTALWFLKISLGCWAAPVKLRPPPIKPPAEF